MFACRDDIVAHVCSNHVGRRLDAIIAEIDFGLAAVMREVDIHKEKDFAAEHAAIGGVMLRVELLLGEA